MKHHIKIVFIFLFSISSFSQDARLFQNEWQLNKLTTNGIDNLKPKDTDGLPVSLSFHEENNEYSFETAVCDINIAAINFDSVKPEFTVMGIVQTLGGCGTFWDPSNVLADYYNFYSTGSILSYEVTENLGVLKLTLTATNGDQAIFVSKLQLKELMKVVGF